MWKRLVTNIGGENAAKKNWVWCHQDFFMQEGLDELLSVFMP